MVYIVLIDCHNNRTGERYVVGDKIPPDAFPKKIIKSWLKKGVLKGVPDGSNSKR